MQLQISQSFEFLKDSQNVNAELLINSSNICISLNDLHDHVYYFTDKFRCIHAVPFLHLMQGWDGKAKKRSQSIMLIKKI